MSHFHHPDRKVLILNGIHDPVPALTKAITFLASQFVVARGSRVLGERLDSIEDLPEVFLWYYAEVFFNGFSEIDSIFGHLFSVS